MATRIRPKVKANLINSKRRKIKPALDVKQQQTAATAKSHTTADSIEPQIESNHVQPIASDNDVGNFTKDCGTAATLKHLRTSDLDDAAAADTNSYFKCPPSVEFVTPSSVDDVFHSDIEDGIKSATSVPSPTQKMAQNHRPRLKQTPFLAHRRNSFITTPSPQHSMDETSVSNDVPLPPARRERHYSASISQSSNPAFASAHFSPHKNSPFGRIRTESSCSAFSDTHLLHKTNRNKTADTAAECQHRAISRREFEARFSKGVPEKSALKMSDLIYYNPDSNPMEQKPNIKDMKRESSVSSYEDRKLKIEAEDSIPDAPTMAMPVPQLKLDANGEIILDDKSLEIESTAELEARKLLAKSSLMYVDENTGMNGFYSKHQRTKDWSPDETLKFYRCLQTIGTDFALMCSLFPNRERRDLKLKFKKEERINPLLINKALLHPKAFDFEELKGQLDKEEQEKAELQRKWQEIKQREVKGLKKAKRNSSGATRLLMNADVIYENENVLAAKFSNRASSVKRKAKSLEQKSKIEGNQEKEITPSSDNEKAKRKRKEKKVPANAYQAQKEIKDLTTLIKTEIKTEQEPRNQGCVVIEPTANNNEPDTAELQQQLNELLQIDLIDEVENTENSIPNLSTNETTHEHNDYDSATANSENCMSTSIAVEDTDRTLLNLNNYTITYINEENDLNQTSKTTATTLTRAPTQIEIETEAEGETTKKLPPVEEIYRVYQANNNFIRNESLNTLAIIVPSNDSMFGALDLSQHDVKILTAADEINDVVEKLSNNVETTRTDQTERLKYVYTDFPQNSMVEIDENDTEIVEENESTDEQVICHIRKNSESNAITDFVAETEQTTADSIELQTADVANTICSSSSGVDTKADAENYSLERIQNLLAGLADGSLVITESTSSPHTNPSYEIYTVDAETCQLSDTPIDVPNTVIECLLQELQSN